MTIAPNSPTSLDPTDAARRRTDPSRTALVSRWHQQSAACITAACLLIVGVYWTLETTRRGSMLDIERLPEPPAATPQIDVNRATWPELTLLPGVSETLARRIVEFRDQNGPFTSWEDLRQVRGIGPLSLRRIRPYLAPVSPPLASSAPSSAPRP